MPALSPDQPFIHPDCEIVESRLGAYVEIGRGSRLRRAEFADYAYCDRYADVANTSVGRFANIAAFTRIGPTDHPMDRASQHHFLYRSSCYWPDAEDDAAVFAARAARLCVLGPDCWIGHGAIVRPEVRVGTGAVVAAGAVVTRDVAPYTIVAGVPAVPLRERFPPEIARRLLALAWWDWPHDRLRAALADFRGLSAAEFLDRHGG
jgi:hypothetical protein